MQTAERRENNPGTDVAIATLIAGLGITLIATGNTFAPLWEGREASVHTGFEAMMGLAASLIGLLLMAWWLLALVAAVAGGVLSKTGHARLGRRMAAYSPAFMRRLVMAVLSINLVALPAATAAPLDEPAAATSAAVGLSHAEAHTGRLPVSLNARGISGVWQPAASAGGEAITPQWKPGKTRPGAGPLIGTKRADAFESRVVTVGPGDTLWSVTAEQLGPYATDVEVAAEWPRWYAANKQTIGPNPDLLRPGQVLNAPVDA